MSTFDVAGGPEVERGPLSTVRNLLVLGRLLTETMDAEEILDFTAASVPTLGGCRVVGLHCPSVGPRWAPPAGVVRQLGALGPLGGRVRLDSGDGAWAYPLGNPLGHFGFLVVADCDPPDAEEQFLLRALAQQAGTALANRQLHLQETTTAARLSEANDALRGTVVALRRSTAIHARLTAVAVSGEGREGIARAVHELTGLPVAIEDRHGNLHAWAGPGRPDPYPKDPADRREQLVRRALAGPHPVRDRDALVALAHPQGDVLGVIRLVDPDRTAGEHEVMALEHGATILAMELARVRSRAESELRMRRDLVDDLLAGVDEESARARAGVLGYDLQRPHRVLVAEAPGRAADTDVLFQAVRRAARQDGAGTLLVARGTQVVLLSDHDVNWETLRGAVIRELGGAAVRIGIGERCTAIAAVPRSYRQAVLALRLAAAAEWTDRTVLFEDLGVHRLLVGNSRLDEVVAFVECWIGPLLAYDSRRGVDLVRTLTHYLDRGGNHQRTAAALVVHRNTLRYRLSRISQITGHDLSDPEACFNLQLATRALQTLAALDVPVGVDTAHRDGPGGVPGVLRGTG